MKTISTCPKPKEIFPKQVASIAVICASSMLYSGNVLRGEREKDEKNH